MKELGMTARAGGGNKDLFAAHTEIAQIGKDRRCQIERNAVLAATLHL
jgi:hypothetical protein